MYMKVPHNVMSTVVAITITPSSICSFAAKPSPPVVLGPAARVSPGQTVNYTCKSHGFSPRNITLKWFKDRNELSHFQTTVDPKGESISYSISSTAQVVLSAGDVHSQITCEVAHDTLPKGRLHGTAKLSDIIRGKWLWNKLKLLFFQNSLVHSSQQAFMHTTQNHRLQPSHNRNCIYFNRSNFGCTD